MYIVYTYFCSYFTKFSLLTLVRSQLHVFCILGPYHYSNGKEISPNTADSRWQYNSQFSINGNEADAMPFQSNHDPNPNETNGNTPGLPFEQTIFKSPQQNDPSLLTAHQVIEEESTDGNEMIQGNHRYVEGEIEPRFELKYDRDKTIMTIGNNFPQSE